MRKNIVVGNWKMNLKKIDAINLVNNVLSLELSDDVEVVFAPSHIYLSKVNEYEIDNYSETLVLNNCNLKSTVLCQLEVLRKLHTDENYRNQMIDEIQVKKQNIKFKERVEAEYFTILYYLRKKKITPSKELSKQEVIDLYKNKIYVTL